MSELLCLLIMPYFKPGDLPPDGYLQWHEWAEVQRKAGIKQSPCLCGKWITPQEREHHTKCRNNDDSQG